MIVLGGESRLVYHGIASILPFEVPEATPFVNDRAVQSVSLPQEDVRSGCKSVKRETVARQLSSQRLNLNVRKVRRDGALTLDDP